MSSSENVKVYVQMTIQLTIDPQTIGVDPLGDRAANEAALRSFLRECESNNTCWDNKCSAALTTKKTFSGKIDY